MRGGAGCPCVQAAGGCEGGCAATGGLQIRGVLMFKPPTIITGKVRHIVNTLYQVAFKNRLGHEGYFSDALRAIASNVSRFSIESSIRSKISFFPNRFILDDEILKKR